MCRALGEPFFRVLRTLNDEGGRRLSCFYCGPFDLDMAFSGTKCESTSCGVSICNTDAAPARRISVAAAVAALVSVLIA